MGEHHVRESTSPNEVRSFTRAILADLHALETMLERGKIEDAVRRVGADSGCLPVVDRGRLVGIATERDFLHAAHGH